MARTYASAKSYADSGVVYTWRDAVRDPASTSFRIHFLRPDRLRFEMLQNIGSPHFPERYEVFWSNGETTYRWAQAYPQTVTCRDAKSTIAAFTGVSGRSAHNIPSLLQRNFGWQEFLYEISSPVLVEEEAFENVNCYRIQGAGRGERRYELWIGKSDYLVRKIITTYSNFSSEEIHRGIKVNQPVCAGMLTFIAPMSADAPGTTGNHTGLRN